MLSGGNGVDQSSRTDYIGDHRKLTTNEGGEGIIRISQKQRGSGKLYRDTTKTLNSTPPPSPLFLLGEMRPPVPYVFVLSTEWPEGKFCILANGRCPRGFRRHEGHLKSLYLYSSHSQFVNSAKFGSSSIGCYGSYCGQYGNFIGSLTLITCCK